MSIINGKALVKDGSPLNRVYSDGQLIYGRNLITGTKDFSGNWTIVYSGSTVNDGTYKGLTVKKMSARWATVYKTFTAPRDDTYTFSAYVKASGSTENIIRNIFINGVESFTMRKSFSNNFDWIIDSLTTTLKANDSIYTKYNITTSGTDSILWTAGHKWEFGSTATLWTPAPEDYI